MKGREVSTMALIAGLTGMFLIFVVSIVNSMHPMMPEEVPVFAIISVSAAFVFIMRGPLGKALARRLEGEIPQEDIATQLERIETRLAELGAPDARVSELEERLDFAERLLAQRAEGGVPRAM